MSSRSLGHTANRPAKGRCVGGRDVGELPFNPTCAAPCEAACRASKGALHVSHAPPPSSKSSSPHSQSVSLSSKSISQARQANRVPNRVDRSTRKLDRSPSQASSPACKATPPPCKPTSPAYNRPSDVCNRPSHASKDTSRACDPVPSVFERDLASSERLWSTGDALASATRAVCCA